MANNYISFENETLKGKYAREINKVLEENNLNWHAFGSATLNLKASKKGEIIKGEILLKPKGNPSWDSTSSKISRVSLQAKNDLLSFGVSGYFPVRVLKDDPIYKENGFRYHDKEGYISPKEASDSYVEDETGKRKGPKGRFWYTKQVNDFPHMIHELKTIEHLLLNGTK
jgi:hypothetical protein